MNINLNLIKKISLGCAIVLGSIYALFLIIPLFINLNGLTNDISKQIEDSTGLKTEFTNLKIITAPNLSAGAKLEKIVVKLPNNEILFSGENLGGKISLLPILSRKIEIDEVFANNIILNLKIEKDGKFSIEKILAQQTQTTPTEVKTTTVIELPFGFKLSNNLPNVKISNHSINFINATNSDAYSINGNELIITDFNLTKSLKIKTSGSAVLKNKKQFSYKANVNSKINTGLDLNNLLTQNSTPQTQTAQQQINLLEIFNTIYKNQLTTNVDVDLKLTGTIDKDININGYINANNMSLAVNGKPLPTSNANIIFSNKNIKIDSALKSADNEVTKILADIATGKKSSLKLDVNSNANLTSIVNIIKSIAESVGIKDLKTLSAKGAIDANFSLNSDFKKITSDGYFKLNDAFIKLGLYNVLIENINANIDFKNNQLEIKNTGFDIASQPIMIQGTIKNDTTLDIRAIADKLSIKGLVAAIGQVALLKDNDFNSGTLSMDTYLQGSFKEILPKAEIVISDINIKNKPSDTILKLANSKLNVSANNSSIAGLINVNHFNIINPLGTINLPLTRININDKNIEIEDSYVLVNNSRIDISGKITDYISDKLNINLNAKGYILANDVVSTIPKDLKSFFNGKGELPVIISITGDNKTQNINAQLLANPTNYIKILDIDKLKNNSTLINSNLSLSENSLKITNTGLFVLTGNKTLSNDIKSNFTGAKPVVTINGDITDIYNTTPKLNLAINTPNTISTTIPGFDNSKINLSANISASGILSNPTLGGNVDITEVSLPNIETSAKNITASLNKNNIYVNCPSFQIANSPMKASANISTNFAKGIIIDNAEYHAELIDADAILNAMIPIFKMFETSTPITSNANTQPTDLGITLKSGKGSVKKLKSGTIIAQDLTGNFNIKNNTLHINNIKGSAFDGTIGGNVSYGLLNGKIGANMQGNGMNALNTIADCAGIKNALTGKLGFNADITTSGATDIDMMKNLKGNVGFSITDGHFLNIGSLESLLGAQNIIGNAILKAATAPILSLQAVKNSAQFKELKGNLTFTNGGWANVNYITTTGPSMAYYITGKMNIVNGSANLTILGRLGDDVVTFLGPLGDLSVNKLTSYIPKFGALTGSLINSMTSSPKAEKTEKIPQLSNGNKNYKDFKVVFNGGIESQSSVKSFKWLSECDTSAIEPQSIKEQLKDAKESLNNLKDNTITDTVKKWESAKQEATKNLEASKQQLQNTKDALKNLLRP